MRSASETAFGFRGLSFGSATAFIACRKAAEGSGALSEETPESGDGMMRLKRLELENFKSFMGELTIPLEGGFTAITGPNGSGKSNSGDAIQFVLGTKSSKSLRAQNIRELIFNGGKRAKAARYCKVSLVFDNPAAKDGSRRLKVESDEVVFTRRVKLNRKNDATSAYYLNDRASSSTEFRRLLIEAGARGDGYNIVLQGDVTNLATMTPRERRRVLEDVAGVTQYDEELKRADRQRKQVEEQLEMIGVFEKDQQKRLKSLEKERKKALELREVKVALDAARITLMHANHQNRFEEIELLSEERTNYIERGEVLSAECTQNESRLQEIEDEIAEVEREMDRVLGDDDKKLIERIRRYEVDIETRRDRIGDAKESIEDATVEAERIRGEREEAENALVGHRGRLENAESSLADALSSLAEAEESEKSARDAIASGDRAVHDLNRAFGRSVDVIAETSDAHQEAVLTADRHRQEAEMAETRLADIEEEHGQAKLQADDLEIEAQELGDSGESVDRTKLAEELHRLQREERTLVDEERTSEERLRDAERRLMQARERLEGKSGSKGNMARAVAAVMALRDSGETPGILGSLGQLTAPKDDSHETALAYALGGAMNSIVVRDDEVAASCISHLKSSNAGRATFLPLTKMSTRRAGGRAIMAARQPGALGFAHDLLDYDPSIEAAVKTAVRDTIVVQSMDVARRLMGGVRMVTLDGSLVESSGAMIGGSSGGRRPQFGGRMPGMSEVDSAASAVGDASLLNETVRGALQTNRESQMDLRARIDAAANDDSSIRARGLQEELRRARDALVACETRLAKQREALAEAKSAHDKAKDAAAATAAAHEAAKSERQRIADALTAQTPDHLSKRLRNAEETRTGAERLRLESESTIATASEHVRILEGQVEDLSRRLAVQEEIVSGSETRIAELAAEIEALESDLTEAREVHAQVSEEHRALDERRLERIEERATLRSSLDAKAQTRQNILVRITELNGQIDQKHRALEELCEEMRALSIEPLPQGSEVPTVAEAEQSVRHLDRRVGQLGDVNMLAIDQYDAAEERVAELRADSKRLRARRDDLVGIAEQLESERRLRLTTVLSAVSENFSRAYEILQPGGRGELRLENPKDPFSGGLDMWAQPPGKSSKTRLNLLSGGEKSMAALALIFAIQDYEPSPFYYFDEVDQNLDAYNAESIATLCRLRSQRAQFIMVTLRKVSLQLADHHIGVTHPGDGCSRLIHDFDREAAIEMGEAAERELEAQKLAAKAREGMPELPKAEDRPRVPEAMPTPKSLGGLDEEALEAAKAAAAEEHFDEESVNPDIEIAEAESETLQNLGSRAQEWREDIDERIEWEESVKAAEESPSEVDGEESPILESASEAGPDEASSE